MNVKRMLERSLTELLQDKPLREITVTEIVQRCEIARSTFYLHFTDKYDLASWILAESQLELRESEYMTNGYRDAIVHAMEYFEKWAPLYKHAVDDPHVQLILERVIRNQGVFFFGVLEHEGALPKDRAGEVLVEQFSRSIVALGLNWALGNVDLTLDEVVDVIVRMTPAELASVVARQ